MCGYGVDNVKTKGKNQFYVEIGNNNSSHCTAPFYFPILGWNSKME